MRAPATSAEQTRENKWNAFALSIAIRIVWLFEEGEDDSQGF